MNTRSPWVLLLAVVGGLFLIEGTWIWGKALLAQVLLRDAWDDTRAGETQVTPWPWADTWPVARLVSPEHDVDLVVLEGAHGSTMAFGPGRMQAGAKPGEEGHVVITAHRDTHFAFLERVTPGEVLWLEADTGQLRAYRVERTMVVQDTDTQHLAATQDAWLTLVTCYPFHAPTPGTSRRYLVQARGMELQGPPHGL